MLCSLASYIILYTVTPGFLATTNATSYYVTFDESDIVNDQVVLNYSIFVEQSSFSTIFQINLALSQMGQYEALFGYDTGETTKNYGQSEIFNLIRAKNYNWIIIREHIYIRDFIPQSLYVNGTASFMFNLNIKIFGNSPNGRALTGNHDTLVYVTVSSMYVDLH